MKKIIRKNYKRWTSTFLAALLLVSTFLPSSLMGRASAAVANHVVISQVFGGGGNSGAPYNKDFIELYNPTDAAVPLSNWSIQYASTAGTTWQVTPLAGTIQPHGYYLITEASGGANGIDLPTADASGAITMAAGAGKVALFNNQTTAASGSMPAGAVDLVGYGTGTVGFEGTGPTQTISATKSAQRRPYEGVDPAPTKGNAWDTDDNATDFFVGAVAAPKNTASPAETPFVPNFSLQPKGINIQFLQQTGSIKVTGTADAVAGNSIVKFYESATKGTALGTTTAASDGSFDVTITTTKVLTSVFVAATQAGKDESPAVEVNVAKASTAVVQAKLSYFVSNGKGTLVGGAGAAAAQSIINVYPNDTANKTEKLVADEIKAGAAGDFSVTFNNAPDTVYVTQLSSSTKGIMLESVPTSILKADTSMVTPLSDVRTFDTKGQPVNLNKFYTIEGVATVDNQILGTQKQNFYIQDNTGGINIFHTSYDPGFSVVKGDKLHITGKVLYYNGLTEFEPVSMEKISEGNPIPAARELTLLDSITFATAEPLEGSLVNVTGKVSASVASGANYNVTFVDENNKTTTLRVMDKTGIKPDTDLVTGKSYTVTGVMGQYTTNVSATSGYQIYPRDVKDIASVLQITHTALTKVYQNANVEFEANADGAESVTVYYRAKGTTAEYRALPMAKGSEGRYTATLEAANVPEDGFEYYIEAKAGTKTQAAGSSAAPFIVELIPDQEGPVINGETPQGGTKVESPHPEISALINDPSGVDEASVHFWFDGNELTAPAATINKNQVKYTPEEDLTLGLHTVKVTAADLKHNPTTYEWTFEVVPRFTGGHHYRGTTHNHTNISHDASGTPEDALKAGKAHHYDWFAFSDHSHDIDPTLLGQDTVDHKGMQERTGGEQWQLTKDLAKKYTKNDDYVVFPAFEMTSTTWGHSNIFGTDNFIDRNINGKQYQDLNKYYAWVMTYDDIVGQFNHPDMSANAFNNFKPYNKDLDKLFTMLEVGNGSGHYGYANADKKFYSALDLGWHVAPTYGEDNHEGTWGQTNARTVIVADDLSQESLMHSMRNMRVYMEEDPNFTLDVLANGFYMGSTVDSKSLKFNISGSDLVAEAHNDSDYNYLPTSYKSDDRIAKVELITNGGTVVDSITPMTKDFKWNPTYTVTGGQQWFVVKVTQMDGERIYSSPIWSKEQAVDVKVNGIDITGDVIVGGNPASLKATVANNGTETVKNLKVDFYYDEVNQDHFIGTNTISSILTKSSAAATATWANPVNGDHKLIVVVTSNDGLDIGDVKYEMPVKIKEPLGIKVLIDANHGNENSSGDSGTYKDNLKSFTLLLQKEGYTVAENKQALTSDVLSNVKILVLTHPRTALTADERTAVANFVKNGGSLLMAGKSNNSTDPTINNSLLGDIGSAIRMGNDGVFDDSKSGNFWGDPKLSPYAVRVHPGLVSNFITDRVSFVDYYSGTSLSGVNNQPLTENGKVVILAKGNETTYQGNIKGGYTYDNVSDATGGSAIPLIASEKIDKGRVIVSGMNIFNDKQMDQSFEPKGNDEFSLNAINWLANRETKVTNISDVRKLADDTEAVIEGTVTTAAGVFFDAFYVQDDTGGIMAYKEAPEGSLKTGDRVRVYGHVKTYETNTEFEFNTFAADVIKIGHVDPLLPKQVATGSATTEENQGLLVKVTGKVVSKYDENSYVINDGSGPVLVFTDGYIVNQSGPVPDLQVGDTLEAVALSGKFVEGNRLRVRDTKELVGTKMTAEQAAAKTEAEAKLALILGADEITYTNQADVQSAVDQAKAAITAALTAGWGQFEVEAFAGYGKIAGAEAKIAQLETAKADAKTEAEAKLALIKDAGQITYSDKSAVQTAISDANAAIAAALSHGWTQTDVEGFAGYEKIAAAEAKLAELETVKAEAKTTTETKLGLIPDASQITHGTVKAAQSAVDEAKAAITAAFAAGWMLTEVESFNGYGKLALAEAKIAQLTDAKSAAKSVAVTKLSAILSSGNINYSNRAAVQLAVNEAKLAIQSALSTGWTQAEVENFPGYEKIAVTEAKIAALEKEEADVIAQQEAKAKAEAEAKARAEAEAKAKAEAEAKAKAEAEAKAKAEAEAKAKAEAAAKAKAEAEAKAAAKAAAEAAAKAAQEAAMQKKALEIQKQADKNIKDYKAALNVLPKLNQYTASIKVDSKGKVDPAKLASALGQYQAVVAELNRAQKTALATSTVANAAILLNKKVSDKVIADFVKKSVTSSKQVDSIIKTLSSKKINTTELNKLSAELKKQKK
ncbi:lamin tail domain-containing protein [Neobacillus sp. PS3-34]|uniref:lamin tail domain-containing protein n=1 Tax=Neobacillus sp. PS3-34 TaxID=3070678 RepID=UPI0027DF4BB1|nr:lamin tail domain-containing protein [Neobacillus sp. PS3-34]WML46610.1 lamin tail domain-containing protein [Neobacillus sp. PS3-34]